MWFKVSYIHITFVMLIQMIMDFHMCLKVLHLSVLSSNSFQVPKCCIYFNLCISLNLQNPIHVKAIWINNAHVV
jgi:hypothetical protein